jgi:hypothetical protein
VVNKSFVESVSFFFNLSFESVELPTKLIEPRLGRAQRSLIIELLFVEQTGPNSSANWFSLDFSQRKFLCDFSALKKFHLVI